MTETPAAATDTQSTLDLVNFETVHEGGIIETPSSFTMLVEIEPREWLTMSEERRTSLYSSYLTYLRSLQFPTQLFIMTTRFDATSYYDHLLEANISHESEGPASAPTGQLPDFNANGDPTPSTPGDVVNADADEVDIPATDGGATDTASVATPLLSLGRHAHADWLRQTISMGSTRDRKFFVAVGVDKGEQDEDEGSRLDAIRGALPFGQSDRAVADPESYLDEVWARTTSVASELPRTQVETEILDSRADVLKVLYEYYRGDEAPIAFEQATFVQADEDTLTDPETGEPLDLEREFEQADRESRLSADQYPDRPGKHTTNSPAEEAGIGGNVHPEFVDRVANNRLLAWYARHIAPIGRGPQYSTPRSVYGGVVTFVLGLLMGASAYGIFAISGAPPTSVAADVTPMVLRELAYGMAAASLPVFLLSLTVLLPAPRIAKVTATFGVAVTGGAIVLFERAFPQAWNTADLTQTNTVLQVYGGGLLLLIIAVALAVRARRFAFDHVGSGPAVSATDGGTSASEPVGPPEREPTQTDDLPTETEPAAATTSAATPDVTPPDNDDGIDADGDPDDPPGDQEATVETEE